MENVVADHLSRLTIAHNTHKPLINDEFPDESLLLVEKTPWYAHIANNLATGSYPQIGKHKIRNSSLQKSTPIIGKSPFYTNIVLIR